MWVFISTTFTSGVSHSKTGNESSYMNPNQTVEEKYLLLHVLHKKTILKSRLNIWELMKRQKSLLSLTRQLPDIAPLGEQIWKKKNTREREQSFIYLLAPAQHTTLTRCSICPSVQSPHKDISLDSNLRLQSNTAAGRAGITVCSCHACLAETWYDHTSGIIIILAHCTASLRVPRICCR